jgi:putative flippase GtrA
MPVRIRPAVHLSPSQVASRYLAFAGLSTAANLGAQQLVVSMAPAAPLMVSIVTGTVLGFGSKYILDKRFVFYDDHASHCDEARKVVTYGLLSVVTTAIFWAFELGFWFVWKTVAGKYCGAVIGLSVGYAMKYWLDRRLVFTHSRVAAPPRSEKAAVEGGVHSRRSGQENEPGRGRILTSRTGS